MRAKGIPHPLAAVAGPGETLLELLRGLGREGVERSFKMGASSLLADRYLIGIHKSDIAPAELFGLCARIGLPDRFVAAMKEEAQAANAFHFGYEGRESGGLYKVYLEFASRLRPDANEPLLLHLAYKWDCANPAVCTVARYVCYPGLGTEAILARLEGLYAGRTGAVALAVVKEVVSLAARRTPVPLMYLEVGEEGNPRASFDIKLHDAGMRVGEIGPLLARLRAHYAIPEAQFRPLMESAAQAGLGHLSGGISREGRDFLTVYHAADDL